MSTQKNLAPARPRDSIADILEQRLPQFLEVAPPTLGGEGGVRRLIRQASIAVARSPELAECTKGSVAMAVLQAVELGLDLAGARPMGWLVPFFDKHTKTSQAKLMLSYQGLAEICYRAGAVQLIQSRVVYEEDDFEVDYGNPLKPVRHIPALSADGQRGQVIGAYAMARLPSVDWPAFEFVDIEDINRIRDASRSRNSKVWVEWFDEMARKTAVRRLTKLIPSRAPILDRALMIDREADGIDDAAPPRRQHSQHKPASAGIEPLPEDGPELDERDASEPPPAKPKAKENAPTHSLHVEIGPDDIAF